MSVPSLGRLEPVDPRTIWKSEAASFTPWLASEHNLELLGDTIGLDLELEATEKNVGPFRADILCKDTLSNSWVLIENQLERTDHTHLGQLITYASGLKAVTIVWIARRICPEHRAALDWLNDITAEGINSFGLEVELWRIGNSAPAPKFNIVSQPNDWAESIRDAATAISEGTLSETKQQQREYWAALSETLEQAKSKSAVKPQKPLPQHWANFSLGKGNVYLVAAVNSVEKRIGAHLALAGLTGKPYYKQLLAQRDAVEKSFGGPLEWRELPGKKESQVGVIKSDTDPTNEADWPAQHKWLRDTLERLHATFSARAKALEAPTGGANGAENAGAPSFPDAEPEPV